MISGAIYASADTEALPQREFLTEGTLCAVAADKAGTEYGVRYDLLQTISVVESGRLFHGRGRLMPTAKDITIPPKKKPLPLLRIFKNKALTALMSVACK